MVKNEEVIEAFLSDRKNIKTKNLSYCNNELLLFGSKIAEKNDLHTFKIRCPYISRTTLKILNMLPNVRVNIKKGVLFLNENIWDGNDIDIIGLLVDV